MPRQGEQLTSCGGPQEGVMEATVLPLSCEMLGGRGVREGAQQGGEGATQAEGAGLITY